MTPQGSKEESAAWQEAGAARRANWALALAGFTCFLLLYGTQPVLPQLTAEFAISPAMASLSVTAGTGAMALLLIPLSLLADRYGRVVVMKWCLLGAAAFALGSALAPDFPALLASRILLGACIAGVPAAAMAYLGEELAPNQRMRAMGLYIAANALGGMSGRFLAALVTEFAGWRYGLAAIGLAGLAAAITALRLIPAGRHFVPQSFRIATLRADLRGIVHDPGLPWLFLTAFFSMGAFVGIYNYLGFRLNLPPYELGPAAIGAIFLLYALGSVSSVLTGGAMTRLALQKIVFWMSLCMAAGIVLTLAAPLPLIIAGLAVFTVGYFAVHAATSAWVGRRAGQRRGLVSGLHLSSYYLGGSLIGSAVGWPWEQYRWPGVVAALLVAVAAGLLVSLRLRRLGEH